jgi:16S rRNA (cytidine1402-2'-O)-methyltransferase
MKHYGILYIVATPIGNLGDITLRAIETLKQVDLIAAEDTRQSLKLLNHYEIKTPIISLHNYNEQKRINYLHQQLLAGKNIALIADAGTPLISDPGYHLVKALRELSLPIVPIPGPCAAITALSASGLATDRFIFEGFLPVKEMALRKKLAELALEERTVILYEAPHRLMRLIDLMLEVLGSERNIVLAKELTKTFETVYRATIPEIKKWLEEDLRRQKGEFVILIEGAVHDENSPIDKEVIRILQLLLTELPPKKAVNLTAKITNVDKRELYSFYNRVLQLAKPLKVCKNEIHCYK